MNTEIIIRHIGRYRLYISIICVLVFISVFGYSYFYQQNRFETKVKFFITKADFIIPEIILNEKNSLISEGANADMQRIRSLASSKKLINHIVDTFNLFERYKIKQDDFLKYEKVYEQLMNNYNLDINDLNEITVTVKDNDVYFALNMARAIMNRINELNNDYFLSVIKVQYRVCEIQIDYLKQQKSDLMDSLNEFKNVLKQYNIPAALFLGLYNNSEDKKDYAFLTFNNDKIELKEVIKGKNQINNLFSKDGEINRYEHIKFNNRLSLELLKEKAPIVIQEQIPFTEKTFLQIFIPPFLEAVKISFFTLLSIVFLMAFEYSNRKYIRMFFGFETQEHFSQQKVSENNFNHSAKHKTIHSETVVQK